MTLGISIHSLREEGDGLYSGSYSGIVSISIHSLREEGDLLKYATLGASEEQKTTAVKRRCSLHGYIIRHGKYKVKCNIAQSLRL